jgi:hypothetical protein
VRGTATRLGRIQAKVDVAAEKLQQHFLGFLLKEVGSHHAEPLFIPIVREPGR